MEAKLFIGDVPHVSTFEFHEHRERAPHLEQFVHRERLMIARNAVAAAVSDVPRDVTTVIDLGCGDGGLLSLIAEIPGTSAVGFDFQPSNSAGWAERGVIAFARNFVDDWVAIPQADIYVMTEVLEHLTDPHRMVRRVRERGAQLVCSSPWTETYESHDECHAWAWDQEGYAQMLTDERFHIRMHTTAGMFQIVWAS